jgi:hypothetical protein
MAQQRNAPKMMVRLSGARRQEYGARGLRCYIVTANVFFRMSVSI